MGNNHHKKLESVMLETRLDMAKECVTFVLGLTTADEQAEATDIINRIKNLSQKVRDKRK